MSGIEFTHRYNEMQSLLYAFAIRLTKDEEDANDLLQETAYKAFKYRKMYQPQTNLRAWLMTIMRNTFINDYRRRKRRQTINDKTDNNYFINSGDFSVANEGESNVLMEEIKKKIESLEDWMRVPFMMHFNGFKYEEIAEQLDIPLGTVKSRIFFARKRLKNMIKEVYGAENLAGILD
jgi:RNA polymerase sigma-70 factor (ECF subfamily)